jgi:hypothetical protein
MLFAQADANKGRVVGTIYDAKQAVVPNASIRVKNLAQGQTREVKSSGSGQYQVIQLDPGEYEIVAEAPGFAATKLDRVTVTVGSAVGLDITLQIQGVTTEIEVADSLVNVVLPAPTATINSLAITDLPINGRRFHDFAALTPAVQVDPSRGQLAFAGQRGINSNIMVDGADYNQPFFGGIRGGERSSTIITVPQSAVQEFQAITTGYSAEYGRSTGGILNVVSKSGSNDWHGEAFYQNRNSELSAKGPIPAPDPSNPSTLINVKPAENLQQWGGGVGGPLRRDKLFLFVAYEQQHAVQPRRVLFPSLLTYTPTPANQAAYDFYKGLEGPFNKTNNAGAGTVKGDYNFSNGSRLTLRYNRSGSEEANAVSVGGLIESYTNNALTQEGIEKDRLHFGTAQYTAIISPSIVNDIRFSGSYEERPRLANSAQPGLTASTIGYYGTRNFLPTTQYDRRFQITDGLSLMQGSHSLKFGVDLNRLRTGQTFGFDQFGTFTISGSNVAQILDIIAGAGSVANRYDATNVSYSRQIGNLIVDYGSTQAALFGQDDWRVRPNLTLNFGIRWEGQWNPEVESSNSSLVSKVNAVTFPNSARLDPTSIPNALGQVMPRAGFAWNPTGNNRLVVRGHAGIFYAASPLLLFSDATGNFRTPPNNVRLFLNNTARGTIYQQFLAAGVNLNQYTPDKLPIIPLDAVQNAAAFGLGAAPDPYLGAGVAAVATDFVNPRSFQSGLGADYRLNDNWSAGVQMNYINTVHLERNRDYNLPAPVITDASSRPMYGIASGGTRTRPISTLGQINVRESSARSMYRGMTFSTQYRGRKFQAGAYYTVAESFSDDDNERDSGGQSSSDSFHYRQDYGYSNMDVRQMFSSYGVYRLPWGLEVSGLFRARSGVPINPRTGADTNQDSYSTDRPLRAPGVVFDRNSFRNRAVVLGNDFRVLKSINLKSERRRLQLSAEFFNLFNLDNVVYGGTASIYGLGVNTAGASVPIDSRWLVLKSSDGRYSTQNQQIGFPFQAQFGARFFF